MRYRDTAICAHNRSHTFNTNSVWTQIDELVQFRTSGGEEPHDGMYQYLTPGNKNLDPQYMEIQREGRGGEERGGGGGGKKEGRERGERDTPTQRCCVCVCFMMVCIRSTREYEHVNILPLSFSPSLPLSFSQVGRRLRRRVPLREPGGERLLRTRRQGHGAVRELRAPYPSVRRMYRSSD